MGSMKDQFGDDLFSHYARPRVVGRGNLPTEARRPAPGGGGPVTPLPPGVPKDVADLFEKFTLELRRNGIERYSSDAILHRIRWHYHVERGDRAFKANNNWTAGLARWLMAKHPAMDGFFETRGSRNAE